MRAPRAVFGSFLVLHGLAHGGVGVTATGAMVRVGRVCTIPGCEVLAYLLWATAMIGWVVAGLGWFGWAPFARWWRVIAAVAAVASVALLPLGWHTAHFYGLGFDLLILAALVPSLIRREWGRPRPRDPDLPRATPRRGTMLRRTGTVLAWSLVAYVAVVLAARPWHIRWGSTEAELAVAIPGDAVLQPTYMVQHAITIAAPPDRVRPWLGRVGTDRSGPFGYAWIARRIGLEIHDLEEVLLLPVGDDSTRFITRIVSSGPPGPAVQGAMTLLVLEPLHFVAERTMMRTIRDRAESPAAIGARR